MTSTVDPDNCFTCGEGSYPENECPKSKRPCGHHCNCSWTQDECCWCGVQFLGDGEEFWPSESDQVTEIGDMDQEKDIEDTDVDVQDVQKPTESNKQDTWPETLNVYSGMLRHRSAIEHALFLGTSDD
jgi:hypothetical protein